jgi:hypothetical protein
LQALAAEVKTAPTGPGLEIDLIKTLRFRIEMKSMVPASVTVPQGRYLIQVSNSVVLAPITIQLDTSDGKRAIEATSPVGRSRSGGFVNLTPDTYTLHVRSRPEWSAQIVVNAGKQK